MKKIVISEFMDTDAVKALQEAHEVVYDPELFGQRSELLQAVKDADALIVRNRTQVNAQLLNAPHKLKVVGRLGVGLDNIDLDTCRQHSIEVIPAIGANANAVAEYVICCAMMLLRGAYAETTAVLAGDWPRDALGNGRETGGTTLGIVGLGSVGRRTAELAQAMGMKVVAYDPGLQSMPQSMGFVTRCVDLDDLLARADVISLHVPLVEATRNLIDASSINRMKPGAIVINVARGGVVDEPALAQALIRGQLGGAALDVFAQEPLKDGAALAGAPNLILTPHIAGVTRESNVRVSSLIAERVAAHLRKS